MSYRDGEVTVKAEEYYDLWDTIAAKDAEIARLEQRISEQGARIAELYLSQKGRILSAKSTEYDIDQLSKQLSTKDAEIARLRGELQKIASINQEYEHPRVTLNWVCITARAALEQKP